MKQRYEPKSAKGNICSYSARISEPEGDKNLHSTLLPKLVWELMAARRLSASGKREDASQLSGERHQYLRR